MRYEIHTCDLCWRAFSDRSATNGGVSLDDGVNLHNWFNVCSGCVEKIKSFISAEVAKDRSKIIYALPKEKEVELKTKITQYANVEAN